MTVSNPDEYRSFLRSALDALKRGDKQSARSLAEQAASLAPVSEEPMLVLAALSSPQESLAYVRQALQVNPESQPALHALEWALKRLDDRSAESEEDLIDIGPLLSARLAILGELVLEPDPPPGPIRPADSPFVAAEALPEPEPPAKAVQAPARPAISGPRPSPAPRTSRPAAARKKSPRSRARILLLAVLGLGALASVCFLVFLLARSLLGRPSLPMQLLPQATAFPALSIPTPDCGTPSLAIGAVTFEIQPLAPAPDGSIPAPAGAPGIAYRVEGTGANSLYVLRPTPENLTLLSTLPAGTSAKVTLSNCNANTFTLAAPEPGLLSAAAMPDQSIPGVTIFVQNDAAGNGFLARGELTEEQISTFNTPASNGADVLAEIGLLETTISTDDSSLQLTVSIYNYGEAPFTLSPADVALTPQGAVPLEMNQSSPRLPEKVNPAETKTFIFTFPRPFTPTATLRIFTVEYDIEGY